MLWSKVGSQILINYEYLSVRAREGRKVGRKGVCVCVRVWWVAMAANKEGEGVWR